VELRISKKLCKGAGLPIIYEAAEVPEITNSSILADKMGNRSLLAAIS